MALEKDKDFTVEPAESAMDRLPPAAPESRRIIDVEPAGPVRIIDSRPGLKKKTSRYDNVKGITHDIVTASSPEEAREIAAKHHGIPPLLARFLILVEPVEYEQVKEQSHEKPSLQDDDGPEPLADGGRDEGRREEQLPGPSGDAAHRQGSGGLPEDSGAVASGGGPSKEVPQAGPDARPALLARWTPLPKPPLSLILTNSMIWATVDDIEKFNNRNLKK